MCDRMTLNTYFEEAWLGSNLGYTELTIRDNCFLGLTAEVNIKGNTGLPVFP